MASDGHFSLNKSKEVPILLQNYSFFTNRFYVEEIFYIVFHVVNYWLVLRNFSHSSFARNTTLEVHKYKYSPMIKLLKGVKPNFSIYKEKEILGFSIFFHGLLYMQFLMW